MKIRQSEKSKHVYHIEEGEIIQAELIEKTGWYFFDEVDLLVNKCYDTEEEAIEAVKRYAETL